MAKAKAVKSLRGAGNSKPAKQAGFGTGASQTGPQAEFQRNVENHDWAKSVKCWRLIALTNQPIRPDSLIAVVKPLVLEGREYMANQEYTKAAPCYCKALVYDPNNLDCLRNLAIIDFADDRSEAALELINRAVNLRTNVASLWHVKAKCHGKLGDTEEARKAIDQAVDQGMDRHALLVEISGLLQAEDPDGATELLLTLLVDTNYELKPEWISIIGTLRKQACFELERKIDWLDLAAEAHPSSFSGLSLNLLPLADTLENNRKLVHLQERYYQWCLEECAKDPLPPLASPPIQGRRIRLGIVSGDFSNHVVARFLLPVVETLDPQSFELLCFSTRDKVEDAARQRFEAVATFADVDPRQPRQLAARVREANLDVCIDTAGFTAYTGLQSFSWRLAPLQLSMIGYPGSTYVPQIDLLLANQTYRPLEPWMHSEALLDLKQSFLAMEIQDDLMEVSPEPPQTKDDIILFGCLVNPYKYQANTIQLWAEVLKATPNSEMAILRPEGKSFGFQKNLIAEFARHGIDKDRLVIINNRGRNIPYYDCYNSIDVALDSMPVTGGTTTYDALSMGVPVVTLKGLNSHQNLSAAIVEMAGLSDCIASTEAEFVAIASRLAQDVERLRQLRQNAYQLRKHPNGPFDTKGFAKSFEQALLQELRQRGLLAPERQPLQATG